MTDFQNKVVWITGASAGIGEALAYAMSAAGATLVLSARRTDALERVKNNCHNPAAVLVLSMDLADANTMPEKVATVLQTFGKIDVLVNNGGVSQRSFAKDTQPEVYRNIMEINFFGTIYLSNLVLAHFLERNEGIFVVLSSVTGKVGLPWRTAYTASKHAVEGFFASLRAEIWQSNIRILMVRPASVNTNIARNALTGDGSAFAAADRNIDNGISPEACAAAIMQAIRSGKTEVHPGPAKERLIFFLNRFFPKVVFNIVKKLKP